MTHVSVHDSEEEGESHTAKNRRVHLFVIRDSISTSDSLEHISEFICLEIRGRNDSMVFSFINLRTVYVSISLYFIDLLFELLNLTKRSPEKTNEKFVSKF